MNKVVIRIWHKNKAGNERTQSHKFRERIWEIGLGLKLNHFPVKKLDGDPGAERNCDRLDMETCF